MLPISHLLSRTETSPLTFLGELASCHGQMLTSLSLSLPPSHSLPSSPLFLAKYMYDLGKVVNSLSLVFFIHGINTIYSQGHYEAETSNSVKSFRADDFI